MGNKYFAKKVMVDGLTFDSKKEAKRYSELKLLEQNGYIQKLETQVKFTLIPTQKKDGRVLFREESYKADFVYIQDGRVVVEDVKGYRGSGAYQIFKIKQKQMYKEFGIEVIEI